MTNSPTRAEGVKALLWLILGGAVLVASFVYLGWLITLLAAMVIGTVVGAVERRKRDERGERMEQLLREQRR